MGAPLDFSPNTYHTIYMKICRLSAFGLVGMDNDDILDAIDRASGNSSRLVMQLSDIMRDPKSSLLIIDRAIFSVQCTMASFGRIRCSKRAAKYALQSMYYARRHHIPNNNTIERMHVDRVIRIVAMTLISCSC